MSDEFNEEWELGVRSQLLSIHESCSRTLNNIQDDLRHILKDLLSTGSSIVFEGRIKTLASVVEKCRSNSVKNPLELNDLCGLRCICNTGQTKTVAVDRIIGNERTWHQVEFWEHPCKSDHSVFSYRSTHIVIEIADENAVRYEGLKGRRIEIQVRTQIMHAWAIASHSLAYKDSKLDNYQSRKLAQASALLETAEDILDDVMENGEKNVYPNS